MKFEFELKTQNEIELASGFMRNLLGLREEAVKGSLESPFAKVSGTVSVSREDKGGEKPPKSDNSGPDKNTVLSTLKTKLDVNQDAVAEALRKYSPEGLAKFSTIPTTSYKAFLKALEGITQ